MKFVVFDCFTKTNSFQAVTACKVHHSTHATVQFFKPETMLKHCSIIVF